jgi:hypothetical protein
MNKDIYNLVDRELLKIEAVSDVFITLKEAGELERNTLTALGVIIEEAVEKIREYLKGEMDGQ